MTFPESEKSEKTSLCIFQRTLKITALIHASLCQLRLRHGEKYRRKMGGTRESLLPSLAASISAAAAVSMSTSLLLSPVESPLPRPAVCHRARCAASLCIVRLLGRQRGGCACVSVFVSLFRGHGRLTTPCSPPPPTTAGTALLHPLLTADYD